ncbi:MAG: zf-HC2 domain-containing protein [Actinobacteria bacterium]|nr:zf-HC2 domain-containing protein [Actinomycetota bacterium]
MKEHCRKVLRDAYLFMDRELLTSAERAEIQSHLEECAPCYERYGLEAHATAAIARLRGHDRCPERLRSHISELLRDL